MQPCAVLGTGVDHVEHLARQLILQLVKTLGHFHKQPDLAVFLHVVPELHGSAAGSVEIGNFKHAAVFRRDLITNIRYRFFLVHLKAPPFWEIIP